jgi:hypothetical protein
MALEINKSTHLGFFAAFPTALQFEAAVHAPILE